MPAIHSRRMASAAIVLWTLAAQHAAALQVHLPAAPIAATDMSDCTALSKRWSDLISQISSEHQACLNAGGPRCENDVETNCDCYECGPFHKARADLTSGSTARYRDEQMRECRNSVFEHQRLVAERKRQLEDDDRRRFEIPLDDRSSLGLQDVPRQRIEITKNNESFSTIADKRRAKWAQRHLKEALKRPAEYLIVQELSKRSELLRRVFQFRDWWNKTKTRQELVVKTWDLLHGKGDPKSKLEWVQGVILEANDSEHVQRHGLARIAFAEALPYIFEEYAMAMSSLQEGLDEYSATERDETAEFNTRLKGVAVLREMNLEERVREAAFAAIGEKSSADFSDMLAIAVQRQNEAIAAAERQIALAAAERKRRAAEERERAAQEAAIAAREAEYRQRIANEAAAERQRQEEQVERQRRAAAEAERQRRARQAEIDRANREWEARSAERDSAWEEYDGGFDAGDITRGLMEGLRRGQQSQTQPGHYPASRGCFAAGTLIWMGDGMLKPIEMIVPGDLVMSVPEDDPLRSDFQPRTVIEAVSREDVSVLHADGLIVTGGHPFLTSDGQWRPLREVDEAVTADGEVEPIQQSGELGKTTVYNLGVDSYATYVVVGEHAWRVHNGGATRGTE